MLLSCSLPIAAPAAGAPKPSVGFFGVSPQAPLAPKDLVRMARLDLTLRVPFYWYEIEPTRGTYDFSRLDALVEQTAATGVPLLPFVAGSPFWMAGDPSVPPLRGSRAVSWEKLLRRLVARYGPRGSLWEKGRPRLPIRRWQIWNEPNFRIFWHPRPSAKGYVDLLRRSARVIRRGDPGARVVAAGLAPVEGGLFPWDFLQRMYRLPGAREAFDIAALHPYSTSLAVLKYELRATRAVMARAGDGLKPLLVTEFGVASDGTYPNPFDLGRLGQARFLEGAYDLMHANRRRWRLGGAYWFTWRDAPTPDPYCVFCAFAGLFDLNGSPKPAWRALGRTIARADAATVR